MFHLKLISMSMIQEYKNFNNNQGGVKAPHNNKENTMPKPKCITCGKNIKRNPNRMKRVPRRTAINWVDAMTPQGQALYAAEFVDNASGRHLLYKYQSSRNLQWSLEQEGKSL